MKKFFSVLSAVLCFGILLNCASAKNENPFIKREWMLVSFERFPKSELIKNRAEINLTGKNKGNKIQGTAVMGCSQIFFTAIFKNNGEVNISELGSAKMACENMDLETAFMKKFENMKRYKIEGHRLTLSDDEDHEMSFIAADWD